MSLNSRHALHGLHVFGPRLVPLGRAALDPSTIGKSHKSGRVEALDATPTDLFLVRLFCRAIWLYARGRCLVCYRETFLRHDASPTCVHALQERYSLVAVVMDHRWE